MNCDMRKFMAVVGLAVIACGGGGDAQAAQSAAEAPAADASVPGGTGTVHEIQMVLTDAGEYRYIPDELTIKVGDTVHWINVSGGIHNVQFKPGQVPDGAEAVLNAAMANRIGPMNGQLMMAPNAVYEISFEGAPDGEYPYVCTPHEMLGMVATLTIE